MNGFRNAKLPENRRKRTRWEVIAHNIIIMLCIRTIVDAVFSVRARAHESVMRKWQIIPRPVHGTHVGYWMYVHVNIDGYLREQNGFFRFKNQKPTLSLGYIL